MLNRSSAMIFAWSDMKIAYINSHRRLLESQVLLGHDSICITSHTQDDACPAQSCTDYRSSDTVPEAAAFVFGGNLTAACHLALQCLNPQCSSCKAIVR